MQRVLIVAFEGVQTLDVTGPGEVFATAARLAERDLYRVELTSTGGGLRVTSSGLRLATRDLAR
ncbi:MAG: AraC family transcriptional regulator, partial [Myxococcales bacterium]|nr:AraC family transcriptional regulator [Myxococcales bacterium]